MNSGEFSKNNTLPVTPVIKFVKASQQINSFDLKQNIFGDNLNNDILFLENGNDDFSENGKNDSFIFDQKYNFLEKFYISEEDKEKKYLSESNNLIRYNYDNYGIENLNSIEFTNLINDDNNKISFEY